MASLTELSKGEEQTITEGKKAIVSGLIENAYSLDDGIGLHSSAVLKLITRRELNDRDKITLGQKESNFLVNPYTIDWRQGKTGFMTNNGPHKVCPLFANTHLAMLNETDRAYFALNGGNNLEDGEINSQTLRAATLKLGSMLALLQQLTYDARELGIEVRPDYKPSPLEKWEHEWERTLGEPLPDIATLYGNARLTLVTTEYIAQPHVRHLLFLPTLPYLS